MRVLLFLLLSQFALAQSLDLGSTMSSGGGGVTSVSASGVLSSSGGATPNITLTGIVPILNGGTGSSTFTSNSTLTTLSALSLPYSQLTGAPAAITALTGDVTATGPGSAAASLVATSNSTITTLTALSLPYSQLTGAPAALSFTSPLSLTSSTVSIPQSTASTSGYFASTDYTKFQTIFYHYPVAAPVVENDIVESIVSTITSQAPLYFVRATNGGATYYPALYGVAKNVSGGYADIFMGAGSIIDGFSFGVFIGVDYYLDNANPGKLTYNPPATGTTSNPIKVGRAMDATHLILNPVGNFIQAKGYITTSDGSYDSTLAVGTNGKFLMANSASTYGIDWFSPVATAPLTYTASTHTWAINLAVPGAIGGTTPSTGAFTTLSASSTVSGTGFSTYLASPPAIGSTAAGTGAFTTLKASSMTNSTSGHLLWSGTAPTIASGFGTSPSVPDNNGTSAFTINVGTGGTATSGVVTMPAATTGWACTVMPKAAPQAGAIMYSAPTGTTSITITNYTAATGVALAWAASAVISVQCKGY